MKKIITILLLFILSINSFSQTESLKIKKLEIKVNALNDSIIKIKQDGASLYILKSNLIHNKLNYQEFSKRLNDFEIKHNNSWVELINHWFIVLGTFVTLFLLIFGKRHFIANYEEKIKDEINKKIAQDVSVYLDTTYKTIKREFDIVEKHKRYKSNSKIIIINKKGTKFPSHFKTVLKLFNTDVDKSDNRIEVDTIAEINSNKEFLEKLKTADLVLIENMEPSEVWDTTKYKSDYKKLADNICDNTTLLYYGTGLFPVNDVHPDKQHFISFVNVASQLYGNMLNLLKYKNELESTQ